MRSGVPVIPFGVQGDFKPFKKIKLNIGKPIYYNLSKEEVNDREKLRELTDELMDEIVKLRDEKIQ